MISSFFAKTKPINYVVLVTLIFGFYAVQFLLGQQTSNYLVKLPLAMAVFFAIIIQTALIDRIVHKTRITQPSTFAIMVFTILLIGFLDLVTQPNIIFANLFMLAAILELLQIDTAKTITIRPFNAAFCICMASLFIPQCALFMPLVWVAIYSFSANKVETWLKPLMAIAAFSIMVFAVVKAFGLSTNWFNRYNFNFNWLVIKQIDFTNSTRLILFLFVVIIMLSAVFLRSSISGGVNLVKLRFLVLFFATALVLALLFFNKNSSLGFILFSFCPAAIVTTNYFEMFSLKKFREPILILGMLIPLTFAIYHMLTA